MTTDSYLQIGSSVTAFVSAIFWFLSAYANVPLMSWAGIGELPKFLSRVSRYNFIAALFAAFAAILAGAGSIFG